MNALTRSLVAFATSVVLVLPPGACGIFLRHAQAEQAAPAKASCCHKVAPVAPPCCPAKAPAQPTIKCCCTHDDALPQKSVLADREPASIYHGLTNHLAPLCGDVLSREAHFAPLPPGPNLQILLCIWHC
jgi:hypothetical protein